MQDDVFFPNLSLIETLTVHVNYFTASCKGMGFIAFLGILLNQIMFTW